MIEVTFSGSTHETSAFGLTQWDKGQKLKIIWEGLPEKFQVHFSSRGSDEAIVVEAESENGTGFADIPDELLRVGADIFAWIYLSENDKQGESVKRAVLYVRPRPKPQNILDEIEPTQQEKLEIILRDINDSIDYMKENGSDAEYMPEYVRKEAGRLSLKLCETIDENSVVFMMSSDAHLKTGDYNSDNSIKHMSQAMRLVAENCRIDFAGYLGDMTAGGSDKSITEAKKEFMAVNSYLHPVFSRVPSLRCHGSEDNLHRAYYRNGDYIDSEEIYSFIGRWNDNADYTCGDKLRGYGYMDLEKEKLRIICLNTSDTQGDKLTPTSETALMGSDQLGWFCSALDLSSKADSHEWGIILMGHHPVNMSDKFVAAESIIEKYVEGGYVNFTLADSTDIVYNFSGKNSAKILAQFHGHLHNYRVNFITDQKIPLIAIPNASLYDNNFYSDPAYSNTANEEYAEEMTFSKTACSADDTAFCVVVLDKSTGVINVLHYGAGKDRIIINGTVSEEIPEDDDENEGGGNNGGNEGNEGDEGGNEGGNEGNEGEEGGDEGGEDDDGEDEVFEYTNLVPLSLSSINSSYGNELGYVDDYGLTSADNIYFLKGYTHTGYMQAGINDTIRVSGGTYDGSIGNYILLMDSNHSLIYSKALNGYSEVNSGVSFTESGILVFEPSKVTGADLTGMTYFRVSTVGVGENLIVTVNEKIDASKTVVLAPPMISYTNIMSYAMDESGADFGTGGYLDGRIINKSGVEADKKKFTVTGYFEVESDVVLRVKGLILDGAEGCCLCVYDANHQLMHNISINKASKPEYGIVYDNGLYTFTPSDATENMAGMTYVRLSGKGSGSTVIITYCEEIT